MTDGPSPGTARRWRELSRRLESRRLALEEAERAAEVSALTGRTTLTIPTGSAVAAGSDALHVVVQAAEPAQPEHPVSLGMRVAAEWSWRIIVVAIAVVATLWAIWQVRLVAFPLFAAVLLAALLATPAARLRSWGLSRGAAAGIVFVTFLVLVFGLLTLTARSLGGQFSEIADQATAGLDEVRLWLSNGPLALSDEQVQQWFDRIGDSLNANADALTTGVISTVTIAAEAVTGIALALFGLFFLLYDGPGIWAWTVRLFPRHAEARADHAGRLAWITLTGYVRGTLLVALFDGIFVAVLLPLLQVPFALPLGVLVFFGAFVPVVGAFLTGALAVLVALVTVNATTALLVLAGIVAIQQLEAHVFQPFVLGRMVRLHPLAVVMAIGVGALVAGIAGAVVAVPVVAVTNTVGKYLAGRLDLGVTLPGSSHTQSADGTGDASPRGEPSDGQVDAVTPQGDRRVT